MFYSCFTVLKSCEESAKFDKTAKKVWDRTWYHQIRSKYGYQENINVAITKLFRKRVPVLNIVIEKARRSRRVTRNFSRQGWFLKIRALR